MQKHKGILFMFTVLVITALACNFPSVTPTPTVDVDVTQTSLALTQIGQNTPAGLPTSTLTPTITLTPTTIPTGTSSVPMVSVSVDTNCRTGPSVVYDYLTGLLVGEKAQVIGKYTSVSPTYWIIRKGSITCWLYGQYATVEGDTSSLPEMVPPPSPTPTFTSTPTATATTVPAAGDLQITDLFQSTGAEVILRISTSPNASLSGNFQYTVYANGAQVAQGSCAIPTGSNVCWTGYVVSGTQSIQGEIDSNNAIAETNEGNNSMTMNCNSNTKTCTP